MTDVEPLDIAKMRKEIDAYVGAIGTWNRLMALCDEVEKLRAQSETAIEVEHQSVNALLEIRKRTRTEWIRNLIDEALPLTSNDDNA